MFENCLNRLPWLPSNLILDFFPISGLDETEKPPLNRTDPFVVVAGQGRAGQVAFRHDRSRRASASTIHLCREEGRKCVGEGRREGG